MQNFRHPRSAPEIRAGASNSPMINLIRTARITSLRVQLWWLRQAMEYSMAAPKKRTRKAPELTPAVQVRKRRPKAKPAPVAVVVADVVAPTVDNPRGVPLEQDMIQFYAHDPLMARRRIHFDSQELIQLLAQSLLSNGMPKEKLAHTRWMWVGGENGCPELYLILPGIEA